MISIIHSSLPPRDPQQIESANNALDFQGGGKLAAHTDNHAVWWSMRELKVTWLCYATAAILLLRRLPSRVEKVGEYDLRDFLAVGVRNANLEDCMVLDRFIALARYVRMLWIMISFTEDNPVFASVEGPYLSSRVARFDLGFGPNLCA